MAIGRISGPLLKSNLERFGVDLAFETDLLYLDVNNSRIGIKNSNPQAELDVTGTVRATNVTVQNQATIGDFTFSGTSIVNNSGDLTFESVDGILFNNDVIIDDILIKDNIITTTSTNADLNFDTNGTGVIKVFSDLVFEQDVTIQGTTLLNEVIVSGIVTANSISTDQISIAGNVIQTTESNADLELRANGTGEIVVAGNNVDITNGLNVTGTSNLNDVTITGDVTQTGNFVSSGDLTVSGNLSANSIDVDSLQLENININGNLIQTTQSDSDLEFEANGSGIIQFNNNVDVTGDIHATGNISADGNITIGNANTDNITINAEVASDIIPDVDDTYELGSSSKRWANVWVNQFNATNIDTTNLAVDGIDLALRQGNIFYVAAEGDDSNSGTHQNDGFASIQQAVSSATAGDTVYIYPGVYTETFPITVPAGVTITGTGIRSVTVQPTVATQDEDAFLLNGETTVENLAIQNFYYNSGNNTGHAFRFANNIAVTSRSPYIRNISVITKGSVTSANDPRGYDEGDAGRGAYLDGSVANPSSAQNVNALFHSVTFITPGVDAITITDGVRVEWLNSFTYFANRSIYAFDGTSGKGSAGKTKLTLAGTSGTFTQGNTLTITSTDGSTVLTGTISSVNGDDIEVSSYLDFNGFDLTPQSITDGVETATSIASFDLRDFGAEVRLIGSASVYGNSGLVGDGPGVLMYAIGHNLSYIGNGKEITNDASTVIQANEIVEDNGATIRFNSVDQIGDFRVGNNFRVEQETGIVTFNSENLEINSVNGITISDNGNTTTITSTEMTLGNLRISGNTIESVSGDLNIDAASNTVNILDNVTVSGDLDVAGSITLNGDITVGDSATDNLFINASIVSDLLPDGVRNLGSNLQQWNNLHVNNLYVDDVKINTNVITTTNTNADLELSANGTGRIFIPDNNVVAQNALTVQGNTTLTDTYVNGVLDLTGDLNQLGNMFVTGDLNVTGVLNVQAGTQFEEILIDDNFITTTTTNADLELRAAGTGVIRVPENAVTISGNLDVTQDTTFATLTATDITANTFTTGDILVDDNFITTTVSNSDLELRADGTGVISIPANDVEISEDLDVQGTTTLQNTVINGTVTHTGDTAQTGDLNITGDVTVTGDVSVSGTAQFEEIEINDNVVRTTTSNADLELRASGTGRVIIPNNDLIVNNDTTVNGTLTATSLSISDITSNTFTTGDILIDDNFITTTQSNSNLELRANGTGSISIQDFEFTNSTISTAGDITLTPGSGIVDFDSTDAVVLPQGTTAQRPTPQNGMLRYNNELDRFEGYDGANWIDLGKGVIDLDEDTRITAELTPGANDNTIRFYAGGTLVADIDSTRFRTDRLEVDDLAIDGNVISSITTNSDIVLDPNGTGAVRIGNFSIKDNVISNVVADSVAEFDAPNGGYFKFTGNRGVVIPVGTNINRPPANETEIGMIRFNSDDERVEVYDGTSWASVAGAASGLDANDAEELAIGIVLALG